MTIMTTKEKLEYIDRSFNTLRAKGIVKTQAEFAQALGISATSLSAAKRGRDGYLTESLINRIEGLMTEKVGNQSAPSEKVAEKGIYVPLETIEMYTAMARSIETLSGMVDRLTTEKSKSKKGVS